MKHLNEDELRQWRSIRDREADLHSQRSDLLAQLVMLNQALAQNTEQVRPVAEERRTLLDAIGKRLKLGATQRIEIDIESGEVSPCQ